MTDAATLPAAQSVEDRAWEFTQAAFKSFDLPKRRLRKYSAIVAELIQGAIDDDRRRIADILDGAASGPDADPDRADVLREVARILRIDREELLLAGLTAMVDEIRAEAIRDEQ